MKEKIKKSINLKGVCIIIGIIYIISLIVMFPVRWKNCRNARISAYTNSSAIDIALQRKLCSPMEFLGF